MAPFLFGRIRMGSCSMYGTSSVVVGQLEAYFSGVDDSLETLEEINDKEE